MSLDTTERIPNLTLGLEPSDNYLEATIDRQSNKPSTSQKFAKETVSRFFTWLEDSPNNATYLQSSAYLLPNGWLKTHQSELRQDIQSRYDNLTYELAWQDVQHLADIDDMYKAHDVAYAGIEHLVADSHNPNLDKPINEINQSIIAVIGATAVRMKYLSDILSPKSGPSFEHVYRQNILSDIRRAAQLESQAAARLMPADEQ